MTVRDIWAILASPEHRRKAAESFREWIDRRLALVPLPVITEFERQLAARAPRCQVCDAEVFITERGRFDIRHDRRKHGVGRGIVREERAPAKAGPSKLKQAVKVVMGRES